MEGDAFLIFIRMRDTRVPHSIRDAKLLLLPCIFPPTTPKNVNYPGKYFNFSTKEEDKARWVTSPLPCQPGTRGEVLLDLCKTRERKGEDRRRPFDAHPSVDVYPNVILIAHIMHSARTGERVNLFEKRGGNWRNLEMLGKFPTKFDGKLGESTCARWSGEQPSVSSKLLPPQFSKPCARAREREHSAPRDRVNFPTSRRESNITE